MKKIVPVVFSTSKEYLPMAMVAMKSLINHTSEDVAYKIFIFHTELTEEDGQCVQQLAKENVSLILMNVDKKVEKYVSDGLFFDSARESNPILSRATFYRLLVAELLPDFDKIIYLDCDLILKEDIQKLYDFDMSDYLFGAVGLCTIATPEGQELYINSGVLLINSKKWREEQYFQLCLDTLKKWIAKGIHIPVPDELVLNATGKGKILFLPSHWNGILGHIIKSHGKEFMNGLEECGIENLSIVHYTRKVHDNIIAALASDFWTVAESITLPTGDTVRNHYLKPLMETEQEIAKEQVFYQEKTRRFLTILAKNKNLPLCFYGAGRDGKNMLALFADSKLNKPLFFVDKNKNLHGTEQHGLQVKSLETALLEHPDLIILITSRNYQKEIYEELVQIVPENRVFFPCLEDIILNQIQFTNIST